MPPLTRDEPLDLLGIYPEQHFTQPPPRYTEATLIKALEEKGIGRPSTYAPILSTIQERVYVERMPDRQLKPTDLGFIVNDLLVKHFPNEVDVGFTAQMEEQLDKVAEGEANWVQVLRDFYAPFKQTLDRAAVEMPEVTLPVETTNEVCDKCGAPMVVKRGRFGKFLACSAFPKCKNTRNLVGERRQREYRRTMSRMQARRNRRKEKQKGTHLLFVQSLSRLQIRAVGQAGENAVSKMWRTNDAQGEDRRQMHQGRLCKRDSTRRGIALLRLTF